VAGLVGITPAAGFVEPMGAIAIGAIVAVICYMAVMYKGKFGYDDTLDTFGVHGVGGTVGALLTGVFCVAAVQSASHDGLIKGAPGAMIPQLAGVAATWVIAAVGTLILLFLIDKTIGLRMKSTDEEVGMDVALHGEEGYVL
jgi:Amt family ammonium transporter